MVQYKKKLKNISRTLRKNMTDTEKFLWYRIRKGQCKNYQFYRQRPIGNYIVDFYCPKGKIILELDGGQHYTPEGTKRDIKRDDYFKKLGLKVLRFSDREILENIEGVLEKIYSNL